MTILALEFSSSRRTAAVLVPGTCPERSGVACEAETRATPAFSLIESALAAAGVARSEIQVIAVGLGPGSSTGIRAAIAIAQGWHLARGVRLVRRGSLEVLAAQLQAAGRRGQVHLAVDAQRRELHVATFDLRADGARLIEPLRLVPVATVESWVRDKDTVLGPDLAGLVPGAGTVWPNALALARQAAGDTANVPPESLEPIHLRGLTFVKAPAPRSWPAPPAGT